MSIVDERGRLFGRWNLLDLVVLILIVGLIPVTYAAFLLFRDQPPIVLSVTPHEIEEAPEIRVTIRGKNFRPYMRVSAGTHQAREFIFKSAEEAELPFASLPPGRYDLVLYDSAQERFRLPQAFAVSPSQLPGTRVIAVGAFGNLDTTGAAQLTAGTALSNAGRIVAVGKASPDVTQIFAGSSQVGVRIPNALRLPAAVEFNCYVRSQQGTPFCVVDGVTVTSNALLMLPTPLGKTPFQVELVRGPEPLQAVPILVRVTGAPSVLAKIKAGDTDRAGTANELATVATVMQAGPVRMVGEAATIDLKLLAQLQPSERGWLYESRILRGGGVLTMRTANYEVAGIVLDVPPVSTPPAP